jgi:hypothetical protein
MVDFAPAVLGGFVGGMAAIAGQFIKSRIDFYAARYNDVCGTIVSAADLSSEYWLLDVDSDESRERSHAEKSAFDRARSLEVRIEGLQELILLGDEDLRSELPRSSREAIAKILPDFLESLTGGQYKARTGRNSVVSAALVQVQAAKLVSEIRSGLRKKHTFAHFFRRIVRRH